MDAVDYALRACYEGRRVVLTGATGFVGSGLARMLATLPCQLVLLVREGKSIGAIPDGEARVSVVAGDLRRRDTWAGVLKDGDYVFHLAAQTSASVALRHPLADLEINLLPILHLLDVCREKALHTRVVFAGTVTEVGVTQKMPVDETVPDQPVTIYDIHKLTAEKYLQCYAQEAVAATVTLRLANVYGPGSPSRRSDRGVLNQMIRKAIRGEPLTVCGEGTFVRDYVFIEDVVHAFLMAGSQLDRLSGAYYVIGSGVGTRFVDAVRLVAARVARKTVRRPRVIHVAPLEAPSLIAQRNFVANSAQFRSATGWAPVVSLAEGIDRTIDYLCADVRRSREAEP